MPDAPLKLLRSFEPTMDWVLEPGDMLYLPPNWGHDGTAVGGDCMTCSVGFRVPSAGELARELLLRLSEDEGAPTLYRDPKQPATAQPGAIPPALEAFARQALQRHLADPQALPRALGELLTEPKPKVWFDSRDALGAADAGAGLQLDARTRMAYDARQVLGHLPALDGVRPGCAPGVETRAAPRQLVELRGQQHQAALRQAQPVGQALQQRRVVQRPVGETRVDGDDAPRTLRHRRREAPQHGVLPAVPAVDDGQGGWRRR